MRSHALRNKKQCTNDHLSHDRNHDILRDANMHTHTHTHTHTYTHMTHTVDIPMSFCKPQEQSDSKFHFRENGMVLELPSFFPLGNRDFY